MRKEHWSDPREWSWFDVWCGVSEFDTAEWTGLLAQYKDNSSTYKTTSEHDTDVALHALKAVELVECIGRGEVDGVVFPTT